MSDDNSSSSDNNAPRGRRGSFTANTFNALFGRPSVSGPSTGTAGTAPQPTPANPQGRRMSISTLGLSGTSPTNNTPFFPGGRRASVSTAGSDSIDESAVEDDEGPSRSVPTTPFARRMSFGAQALFNTRGGTAGSPTSANGRAPSYTTSSPLSPIADSDGAGGSRDNVQNKSSQASTQSKPRTVSDLSSSRSADGLNWSEQFRSRAESAVHRPSFGSAGASTSPGMMTKSPNGTHDRAKSFSEMPSPPTQVPAPPQKEMSALRRKPDAVGERILRGEFYMD